MRPPEPISCPSCGAPAPFRGTAVSLVCEFCTTTIVRSGVDVRMVGKVSAILDTGSPILLNAQGRHENSPFEVVGRLQVQYQRGTWNEWYINFADGSVGWLSDAQGSYSIVRPKDPKIVRDQVPVYSKVSVGRALTVAGIRVIAVDCRAASYQGAEGSLPFEAEPGMTFYGIDLRGEQGEFVTLDYANSADHSRPTPYIGASVRLPALELRPIRKFEGWDD